MAVDSRAETSERAVPGAAFAWGTVLFASWVAVGAHIDAWAHNHGKVDTSFFTPWHALLYTGVLCTMAYLGLASLRGVRAGRPPLKSLPVGYLQSFAGALLFGGFGGFDLVWHELFGIENDAVALFSPSHLGLMVSGFLIASGPWVHARATGERTASWLVVISAALSLSMIWFWAQFALPYGNPWAAYQENDAAFTQGILGILLATATLVGTLLMLLRHFELKPGSVTVIVALPAMLDIAVIGPEHPFALHMSVLAAGLLGDLVLFFVGTEGLRVRITATAIPLVTWSVYFATIEAAFDGGIVWVVHAWTGAITVAAIAGYLLSMLAFPPERVTR
ncbi:hypothetical protein [Actinocorallia longicatena]|uniref:Uncharacterized protein n=1 Tax=Actinocorallia longicatena TaxID=111803 RepID=A0ABP6PX68_9ACTN